MPRRSADPCERIIRTSRADEDLIDIWTYVAGENPYAADRVLDAIEKGWQQLSFFPQSGAARDDIAPGIRHQVVGQYLTLYRVSEVSVTILRVLHGKRQIDSDVVQ